MADEIRPAWYNEACLVYLDNVTTVVRTFPEQRDYLRKVFQKSRGAFNPEMCQLFQKEVQYMRHYSLGMTIDPEKLEAQQHP
jgi:hypothetical protein